MFGATGTGQILLCFYQHIVDLDALGRTICVDT